MKGVLNMEEKLKEKFFNDLVVPNLNFIMEKFDDAESPAEIRSLRKLYINFLETHANIMGVSMVELELMYLDTLTHK